MKIKPLMSGWACAGILSVLAGSTWTGGAGNGNLDDAANWGGTLPGETETATLNVTLPNALGLGASSCTFYRMSITKDNTLDLGAGKTCYLSSRFTLGGIGTVLTLRSGTFGIDPDALAPERVFLGDQQDKNVTLVVDGSDAVFRGARGTGNNRYIAIGQNTGGNAILVRNGGTLVGQIALGTYWYNDAGKENSLTVTGRGSRYVLAENDPFRLGWMQPSNVVTFADGAVGSISNDVEVGGLQYNDYVATKWRSSEGNVLRVNGGASVEIPRNTLYLGKASDGNFLEVITGGRLSTANLYVGYDRGSGDPVLSSVSGNCVRVMDGESQLTVRNLRLGVRKAVENRVEIGDGGCLVIQDNGVVEVGYGKDDATGAGYAACGNEIAVLRGGRLVADGAKGFRFNLGRSATAAGNVLRIEGCLDMTNCVDEANAVGVVGLGGHASVFTVANGGVVNATNLAILVGRNASAAESAVSVTNRAEVVLGAGNQNPRITIGYAAPRCTLTVDDATVFAPAHYLVIGTTAEADGSCATFSGGASAMLKRVIVGDNGSNGSLVVSNAALTVNEQLDVCYSSGAGENRLVFAGTNSGVRVKGMFRPRGQTVIEVRATSEATFPSALVACRKLEDAENVTPTIRLTGRLAVPVTVLEVTGDGEGISDAQFARMAFDLPETVRVHRSAHAVILKPRRGLALIIK